jgi:hypothetical protein
MKKTSSAVLLALALATPAFAQDATEAAAAEAAPMAEAAPAAEAAPMAEAAPAAAPMTDEAPAVAAALSPAIVAKVGTPEPGKGLVVFYRPAKFVGGGAGIKVHEGEMEHGKLGNGTFLVLNMEPGTHEFVAVGEVKDRNPIEVEAGETYFISAAIGMGLVAGRKNFALTDAAAFEAVMAKLKPAKPLKK